MYCTLHGLLAPVLPQDKDYDSLLSSLRKHYDPKPLVIAEILRFYKRSQSSTESITDFTEDLHRLSIHCEFGLFLEEALRDWFVCGVNNEQIQNKLLAEAGLTIDHSLKVALAMEAADKNS